MGYMLNTLCSKYTKFVLRHTEVGRHGIVFSELVKILEIQTQHFHSFLTDNSSAVARHNGKFVSVELATVD